MKTTTKRFAIVRETEAHQFEDRLNETWSQLNDKSPKVTFTESGDYMTARFEYEEPIERVEVPISETGIRFTCEDCPLFENLLKRDGTEDGRIKYGNCQLAHFGRTYKASPACEYLYRMIENGEVGLCSLR